jgi:hypothetical protein
MPPVEFEPTIPASSRQKTDTLDCAATGIDTLNVLESINWRRHKIRINCPEFEVRCSWISEGFYVHRNLQTLATRRILMRKNRSEIWDGVRRFVGFGGRLLFNHMVPQQQS